MQRIESPTSKEHLGRLIFFLVACVGLGSYFLYDSFIGYPRANVPKLAEKFEPVPDEAALNALKQHIRADITPAWKDHFAPGDALSEVREKMGEPTHVDRGPDGALHYLGRGGLLTVRHKFDKVTAVDWTDGKHRPSDLQMQLLFAGICAVAGVVVLVGLVRALRIKTVVSDEGLSPAPGELISWEAMRAFNTSEYKAKGWIFLRHEKDGQVAETKLDNYKIREFRPIVSAVCARKGFASPFENGPRTEATPDRPADGDEDRG